MSDKKIILLVDDDSDDCEFFYEALNTLDPSVICHIANNGEEALFKLHNEMKPLPDFIFLDLNMPRMDGKTCLVEIKKDNYLKSIPLIIYSTSSHQKDIEETRSLGANYFITKPIELKTLIDEIGFIMSEEFLKQTI